MHLDKQGYRPVTRVTKSQVARMGPAEAARQQALLRIGSDKPRQGDRYLGDRRKVRPD